MNNKYENSIFISDLDGTLLNTDSMLPERTVFHLNKLISSGVKVAFATARTYYSVAHIMKDVPMIYPTALLNGVLIRDMNEKKNLRVYDIEAGTAFQIHEDLKKFKINPFVYFMDGDDLRACYTDIDDLHMKRFMDERIRKYGKKFYKIDDVCSVPWKIIYFTAVGEKEKLMYASEKISAYPGICTACYGSTREKEWYLEVFSEKASKRNAVLEIKQITGSDSLICFGDNLNDLSMFEVSNESYAVNSAVEEIVKKASGIVEPPCQCGVTRKIASLTGIEL